MSKRKSGGSYSFVFIMAEEKKDILDKVSKIIEDHTGVIKKKDEWGKKHFAYPINKNSHGYYYDWTFTMPKAQIKEFKKKLDFEALVVRYLVLAQA